MPQKAPQTLVELLERLDLATAEQIHRMVGRVRRLARGLPLFETVWVDALAQARVLTPFQAAQINAGRGDSLHIGPYVLLHPLPGCGYAAFYEAGEIGSQRIVRLAVIDSSAEAAPETAPETALRLKSLVAGLERLDSDHLAPVVCAGEDGEQIWAAGRHVDGRTVGEWMIHNGRFPPETVLEIARQMAAALVTLEAEGLCHGDLGAWTAIVTDAGRVVLVDPGLRGIVRPEEGYAHANLAPEAYDYLDPERTSDGGPPTSQSDVYACGCLWWHLLTGRPPVPGGSSLAKLRAAQTQSIPDVRRLAPETPGPLAAAISASTRRERSLRPESMARLAAQLGPPTHAGRLALARCATRPGRRPASRPVSMRTAGNWRQSPFWLATTAGGLVAVAGLVWSLWQTGLPTPAANIPGPAPSGTRNLPVHRAAQGHDAHSTGTNAPAEEQLSGTRVPDVLPTEDRTLSGSGDLVLAAGEPLAIDSLELRPGQTVRGRPDERPLVVVPPGGLVVQAERTRFENIDFVSQGDSGGPSATPGREAVILVEASRAEFHGCSFRSASRSAALPAAICWVHPLQRNRLELSLPGGRLQLTDCVLDNVGAGVACRTAGALAVQMTNVLHLGTGPLIYLDHCPGPDEPVAIHLSELTLRGAGPLLECRYQRIGGQPGKISIQALQCAFVPGQEAALLRLAGPTSPDRLLDRVVWTGQGSLVSPEVVIARWQGPDGHIAELDDASVSIAGLVRSEVQFAGPPADGPRASRITRWQVPLQSPDPPGIDALSLPSDGPIGKDS